MSHVIESINIHGFRSFSHLEIPTFGKVNLITGKNNTGKSSLLEAIRILIARGSLSVIDSILDHREEMNELKRRERLSELSDFDLVELSTGDLGPYRNLFTGFPVFGDGTASLSIRATGEIFKSADTLSISTRWAVVEEQQGLFKGPLKLKLLDVGMFESFTEVIPALYIQTSNSEQLLSLQRVINRASISPILSSYELRSSELIRCIYLEPFNPSMTSQFGRLWDAIALTDVQDEVVKAMQLISPDIQNVSMVGDDGASFRRRIAIVKSSKFDRPVPLRTYGDGVNRLFGVVLSLCNVRNGVLLIDEFENGLHYSVQAKIWQTIFRLAEELNVQVFATTHSSDCIKAFQQAATENLLDGTLIRLTRKEDKVVSTVFDEEELKIVTQHDIEVR